MTPAGAFLGLTADSIGRQLRAAYSGSRVQIFNDAMNPRSKCAPCCRTASATISAA
jgi:hypothetical protein